MSQRYTDEQKQNALDQLQANGGNIAHTSQQVGIPERTLRHWRREQWLTQPHEDLPLPPHPLRRQQQMSLLDAGLSDSEVLIILRRQIIEHILSVTPTLIDGLNTISPYHRILALSQLLDHLQRIEAYIPRTAWREKYNSQPDLESVINALNANLDALIESASAQPIPEQS